MGYDSKHPSWQILKDLIDEFVQKYSGCIYDTEAGRTWDPGQAICRGVWGPDWSNNPEKQKFDEPDNPAPESAIIMLRDWINNGLPSWATTI